MREHGQVVFELAEALARSDSAEQRVDSLARAVDAAWDLINPHNAMELALVVGERLPDPARTQFGQQVRDLLQEREDFEREMQHNSANHCLKRVIENDYGGR